MDLVSYLLKANIAIILLYGCYILFFRKDTFFRMKRGILMISILFAIIYPTIHIPEIWKGHTPVLAVQNQVFTLPEFLVLAQADATPVFSPVQVIYWVYLLGVAVVAGLFLIQFFFLLLEIRRSKPGLLHGVRIRTLENVRTPFSFFRWIVLDPHLHKEEELDEILLHEQTHANQWHSIDVILSECLCILCWFNPLTWIMKRDIRMNLEYLADHTVLSSDCNPEHYQLHLLRISYHKAIAQISNNFNVSPLKKRIQMMNKKETHWTGMLKYVLFVPLAMCVLFASNLQAQEKMNGEPVAEVELGKITMLQQPEKAPSKSKTQVVVIPAPKAKDMAEQMPVFPGGDKELMIYLANNLKYPESAIRDSIQGRVVCQFIVTKAGEITDVVIKRGLSPDIDAEALRVVKAMPKWVPGKDKGEPVDVYFTLPIRFQLTQYTSSRSDSPDRESGNNRRFIMTTGSASIEQ